MCYLVAKDRDAHDCFALKTTHGKHLVELKRELNKAVGYKGIQLVTISRPTAYGEYAKELWIDRREKSKSLDRQGTVCCAWEKTAFEEVLKVGMRLMVEVLDV